MRLLFARVGVPYSPATGLPIESQTVSQMVDRVLALPEGTRLYLLAPIARGRKGEYRKEFAELQKKGFQRLKVDGTFTRSPKSPALDKKFKHDIDVVVDRVVVRPTERRGSPIPSRRRFSFPTASPWSSLRIVLQPHPSRRGLRPLLRMSDHTPHPEEARSAVSKGEAAPERIIFSAKFACPVSGFTIEEIEPRLFSFNNPYGACPACDGLGTELFFEADLVVPDEN